MDAVRGTHPHEKGVNEVHNELVFHPQVPVDSPHCILGLQSSKKEISSFDMENLRFLGCLLLFFVFSLSCAELVRSEALLPNLPCTCRQEDRNFS